MVDHPPSFLDGGMSAVDFRRHYADPVQAHNCSYQTRGIHMINDYIEERHSVFVPERQASRTGSGALSERQASRTGSGALSERQASRTGSGALSERQASRTGSGALSDGMDDSLSFLDGGISAADFRVHYIAPAPCSPPPHIAHGNVGGRRRQDGCTAVKNTA